jgi:hypothetical protein
MQGQSRVRVAQVADAIVHRTRVYGGRMNQMHVLYIVWISSQHQLFSRKFRKFSVGSNRSAPTRCPP